MQKKLLFLCFFLSSYVFSQEIKLSQSAQISVLTCGRGYQELYMTFGHTGIRVFDAQNNFDVVYNYGNFDFNEGNFYAKFVKGDLQYFATVCNYQDFIAEYQYQNREVIAQTLQLPQTKKQQLFTILNQSLLPENRYYTYKFIDRNCTTLAIEKINEVIGSNAIKKIDNTKISYRKLLYPYFDNFFYFKLGINIIFGANTDAKAQKLFLPTELLNSLDNYRYQGKPIVAKKEIVVAQKNNFPRSFSFINSIYFIIILLTAIVIINSKKITTIYFIICALLGLFLCAVGLYSYHKELLYNYNALLFNPLFLLLFLVKNKTYFIVFYSICIATILYFFIMINKPHLFIMLPFIVANTILLFRLKQKSLLTSIK